MEIDGRIKRNMSVVVAPPAMEEGLLGQDFYEGYEIAIKEDIIEFADMDNSGSVKFQFDLWL
jgi:hypothetical protein